MCIYIYIEDCPHIQIYIYVYEYKYIFIYIYILSRIVVSCPTYYRILFHIIVYYPISLNA